MTSQGFATRMSFAQLMSKKYEDASKVREEKYKIKQQMYQDKYESIEAVRSRIKERSEISSALKETSRLTLEAKERLERRQIELRSKLRQSIKKDVLLQISRNEKAIEEQKTMVRVKQLQEILGTDESDLTRLEKMHKKRQKVLK